MESSFDTTTLIWIVVLLTALVSCVLWIVLRALWAAYIDVFGGGSKEGLKRIAKGSAYSTWMLVAAAFTFPLFYEYLLWGAGAGLIISAVSGCGAAMLSSKPGIPQSAQPGSKHAHRRNHPVAARPLRRRSKRH